MDDRVRVTHRDERHGGAAAPGRAPARRTPLRTVSSRGHALDIRLVDRERNDKMMRLEAGGGSSKPDWWSTSAADVRGVLGAGRRVSVLCAYVIRWGEKRADGRAFAPQSIHQPEAVVGSVVSSHLNYHQPVGLVTAAENDATGCLITVQLDFGKGRDRTPALVAVYSVKQAAMNDDGVEHVVAATLLHVSLGG